MKCLICDQEMEEYSNDLHGVSEFSLSPTTYAGSVFACPMHGTREMQEEREYRMQAMFTVIAWDYLSGDEDPMVIDKFNTLEEAVDFGAGLLEEVAIECSDERTQLRPVFKKLAKTMRRGHGIVLHAGLDGYDVRIFTPDQPLPEGIENFV